MSKFKALPIFEERRLASPYIFCFFLNILCQPLDLPFIEPCVPEEGAWTWPVSRTLYNETAV